MTNPFDEPSDVSGLTPFERAAPRLFGLSSLLAGAAICIGFSLFAACLVLQAEQA